MDITEFKTMLGSIREAFGVNSYDPGPTPRRKHQSDRDHGQPGVPDGPQRRRDEISSARFAATSATIDLEDQVEVMAGESGVIVRMKDNVLFDNGSAVVKDEGLPILIQIGHLASAFPEGLSIEGHTDDRPINTSRFPSNWELSTARATEALRALRANVDLEVTRLQVVGYADTVPIVPNESVENRAVNRRVEFVFRRTAPRAVEFTEAGELMDETEANADGSGDATPPDNDSLADEGNHPGASRSGSATSGTASSPQP